MKNSLHLLLSFVVLLFTAPAASAQCNAEFTWEQIPGTLQIHFHSTSTSEFDITSYQWMFGDGQQGDGSNPYHTYAEPDTYQVCLIITDSEGCVSDVCHQVPVQAVQSNCNAQFTWEQLPGTLQIHFNSTSTSEFDIVSYQWNFGDGLQGDGENPYHTYAEPGEYLVCLIITDDEGCVSDVCHEIVVEGLPPTCDAEFVWEQNPGTLEVDFSSTSTSEHEIVSYHWNFGDGDEGDGANTFHVYDEPGVYVVCLIIEDETGCVSDVCHEVVVEGAANTCDAAFTWEQLPGTLQIHFHSTSTSEYDIVSYHWNFGDGDEGDGSNPYHTYDEPGVYVVCLIIEDESGCVSDVCHEVVVEEIQPGECHAEFVWEQIPGTQQIHFISTSTSEHDIVSYVWHFGDGHNGDGNDPYHTYEEPGVYVVCLIITDESGCASDVCHEVNVQPLEEECHAAFTWDILPDSLGVHFFSQSTSEHDIISYHWTFGDGHDSNDQNPFHLYAEPGVYLVCLRIEDNTGCVSEICHEVTVGEPQAGCHAQFTWEQIPGTLQIHFHSTSTSEFDITSYHWNFGDGHEGDGSNPYHTYEEPGVYLVCLIITDSEGCVSDVCHEVVVEGIQSGCHAQFTWEQIPGTLQIHFHSTSTSEFDITSYTWHFGDGHEGDGSNPYHTYEEPGVYLVCLIITDSEGCVSDVCHEVVVEAPECNASFTYEVENGTVFFNNTSTGSTPFTNWLWQFGDGSTSTEENPQHEYAESGMYTVCLIMTDTTTGCVDDICITLVVELGIQPLQFDAVPYSSLLVADAPVFLHQDLKTIRYTNPVDQNLLVEYQMEKKGAIQIELYDLHGYRISMARADHTQKGEYQHTTDVSRLHPGMYILSVMINGERKTMGVTVSR